MFQFLLKLYITTTTLIIMSSVIFIKVVIQTSKHENTRDTHNHLI